MFLKKNIKMIYYIHLKIHNSCVPYVPEPEDSILLKTTYKMYLKFQQDQLALRCAIQLNDMDLMHEVFYGCKDA